MPSQPRRLGFWMIAMTLALPQTAWAQVPSVPAGHPRVYLRAQDLDAIRAKLDQPAFSELWSDVRASFNPVCRAFVSLMTGDATPCRQAITSSLSQLQNCDDARVIENPMHFAAIVYDWCYDQLTDNEKQDFIAEFQRVASLDPPGYPADPDAGAVVGHSTEGWLLSDQLPAGVAIYDESQTMYDAAAALFFDKFVPVRNFFYPAHMHHQGDSYTATRFQHDMAATWLFRRMGAGDVFVPDQGQVPYQLIYSMRPDQQQMRSGDTYDDKGKSNNKRRIMLLAGSYYEDPYLLFMADYDYFWSLADLDKVFAILFRPVGMETKPISDLPPARYFPEPMGEMVARTGWTFGTDSRDALISMRIGSVFFGNHQRKDFGTFQIYYRGPLAISSGVYQGDTEHYGGPHWTNYYHQTISHNGLLIFDPDEHMMFHGTEVANDGGEKWPKNGEDHPRNLDQLLASYVMGHVLGHEIGPDPSRYDYAYLSGDITGAYSGDKVSQVTRSMAALNLHDARYPMSLVVFDRVTSTDPSFKKTWLLHSIQEPSIDGRTITVVRTGPTYDGNGEYGGKLVAQNLLPEAATLTKIGGPGKEFWVESTQTNYDTSKGGAAEPGAWRVEVSPSDPAQDDRFLHVLTVMDATNQQGPDVTLLQGDSHLGAAVLDRAVLFGRNIGPLDHADFDLPGQGDRRVLVCDLAAGHWLVERDGQTVADGDVTEEGTCLYFTAGPGSYHLEPGTLHPNGDGGLDQDSSLSGDGGRDATSQDGTGRSGCSCSTTSSRSQELATFLFLILLFAAWLVLRKHRFQDR